MSETSGDQVGRERIDMRPVVDVAIEPGFEEAEFGFATCLFEAAVNVGGEDAVLNELTLPKSGAELVALGDGPGLDFAIGIGRDALDFWRGNATGGYGFLEESLGGGRGAGVRLRFEGGADGVQ